jgi:CHAD domain-containing protein
VANSAAEDHYERELKFDVSADWTLPEPPRPVAAGVEREVVRLETTYFDTDARDLLRSRLTLRRRRGDADEGWQLKVPAGAGRTEIRLPPSGDGVPAELAELTLGVRGGRALRPLATLVTERHVHRLRARGGATLAEIAVDDVTAGPTREAGHPLRWHEVEVELADGDERLLRTLAGWLADSGARPSASSSKLGRAVGLEPVPTRDLTTLAGLAGAYLDAQFDAIVRGDIELRRGHDVVHPTRVGTRRYRSVLRELAPLFEPDRTVVLDAELAWFAAALGAVRDRRVLRAHLAESIGGLPAALVLGPVAARIGEALAREESDALHALSTVMRGERYFALLAQLRAWREEPPLVGDEPARHIARYLTRAQRRVARRVAAAAHATDRDQALHRARKAAKRARYLAELAVPELGRHAEAVRDQMKATQDRLGLRQDGLIAAEFLHRHGAAAGAAGENGFTYGLLYERELTRARSIDH